MLSHSDTNTHTMCVYKTPSNGFLVVEVLMRIDPKYAGVVSKWKVSVTSTLLYLYRYKQDKGIVIASHMLCNYFRNILHEPPPFFISIKCFKEVVQVRDCIRKRLRVISKDEVLYILTNGLDIGIPVSEKVVVCNKTTRDSLKKDHLSLLVSRGYMGVNKGNTHIPLIITN